jgi:hypothetical protein
MKKILNSIMILSALTAFASCDGMMDTHKEFIESGEIIYAPKMDSLTFIAGQGRIYFGFWLYNAPNVKTVDVYWNSRQDSLLIPVSASAERDSFFVMLNNMQEQSYTFDVRTTDNFGHKSLWSTDFGNSYGSTYESTIANRRVREVKLSDKGGEVVWFAGGEGLVRVEVRYTTNSGATATVFTSPDESTTLLPNAKGGSTFEYRSLFIPEEESVDTFALAWKTEETAFPTIYLYDRSDWEVLAVSDETASDGGGMHKLLDGDHGTYWHSQWDGGNAPLPHWAVIDMTSSKRIIKIETYRRSGNTDTKTLQYFVGDNPDADAGTWVKIGEGAFTSGNILTIDIPSDVDTAKGRYLKLLLPDSNRDPFISIAEIYLYGN